MLGIEYDFSTAYPNIPSLLFKVVTYTHTEAKVNRSSNAPEENNKYTIQNEFLRRKEN